MASRDFRFLTLRGVQAFQNNGARATPGSILTVAGIGEGIFSTSISPCTIFTSTLYANTINANTIDVNTLSTTSHFTSTISSCCISTGYLEATNIVTDTLSSNIISNSSLITTSSLQVNNTLSSNIISNSSLITTSSLQVNNTLSSNIISNSSLITTSSLQVNNNANISGALQGTTANFSIYTSTALLRAPVIELTNLSDDIQLTTDGTDLFVGGFPVITEGNISSISSLYWEDDLGSGTLSGAIFNKNTGQAGSNYMVGIGTGPTLNATLDVQYTAGSVLGNAFNVSTNNNNFTIINSFDETYDYMNVRIANNQDNPFSSPLEFIKTKNYGTPDNSELGCIVFNSINSSLTNALGPMILARQIGTISSFVPSELLFYTATSSSRNLTMTLSSDGNVGIGTNNPSAILHIVENSTHTVYNMPGIYTLTVPMDATLVEFEMIGAGGPSGNNNSGTGGYIKGTINLSDFRGDQITIVVGQVGQLNISGGVTSGATYIYKQTSGPLFVIAGAGGSAANEGSPQYGGWGGGGTFDNDSNVAIGGDGQPAPGGTAGQGGQINGGGAAGSCLPQMGAPGQGRPDIETYQEVLGGSNSMSVPGGNGYTGGGSGCGGGGGGSSYINPDYITVTLSYPGNTLPVSILSEYGRTGKSGYISLTFPSTIPAIITNGSVGIGNTAPYNTLQVDVTAQDGLTGIAANSLAVNTIIGAYSDNFLFLNQNVGSIQVTTDNDSYFPYTLALNPRGGDVYIGSTTYNTHIESISTFTNNLKPTNIIDSANNIGSAGQVLSATGSGVLWTSGSGPAGTETRELVIFTDPSTSLITQSDNGTFTAIIGTEQACNPGDYWLISGLGYIESNPDPEGALTLCLQFNEFPGVPWNIIYSTATGTRVIQSFTIVIKVPLNCTGFNLGILATPIKSNYNAVAKVNSLIYTKLNLS